MSAQSGSDEALARAADAVKRWMEESPRARDAARAIAAWLLEVTRQDEGQTERAEETKAAQAVEIKHEAVQAAGNEAVIGAQAGGEAKAPVLRPKAITGPKVIQPAVPAMDPVEAMAALAAGLGGGGSVSPRSAEAHAGPAPDQGSAIEISMSVIARRCEIKADACEFARARNERGFDEVKAVYDDLRAQANTVQPCYLWAIQRDTEWLDDGLLEAAAGCYRNLGKAAGLADEWPDDNGVLELLAEAQGAVFQLLHGIEQARGDDRDQRTAFAWLRGRAERGEIDSRVINVARDVDASAWRGLAARLAAMRERMEESRKGDRTRRQALKTLEYHAERIAEADEGEGGSALAHDWKKVEESAAAFLAAGAQASDKSLVGALMPIADRVPESMLEGTAIGRAMPYVDERLSEAEDEDSDSAPAARRVTEELLRVRELLRGKVVVLLGGKCRHKSKRLIERELELKELDWISSDSHDSIAPFEANIARDDVAAVLMMIRWSSHSYEGIKAFCVKHGKAYVRVPGGYNPNQLAHQILEQQGGRLGSDGVTE